MFRALRRALALASSSSFLPTHCPHATTHRAVFAACDNVERRGSNACDAAVVGVDDFKDLCTIHAIVATQRAVRPP